MDAFFITGLVSLLDPGRWLVAWIAGWWIKQPVVSYVTAGVLNVGLSLALNSKISDLSLAGSVAVTLLMTWIFRTWSLARQRKAERATTPLEGDPAKGRQLDLAQLIGAAEPARLIIESVLIKLESTFAFEGDLKPTEISKALIDHVAGQRPDLIKASRHPLGLAALALSSGVQTVYVDQRTVRNACIFTLGEILKKEAAIPGTFGEWDQRFLAIGQKVIEDCAAEPDPIGDALRRFEDSTEA
jgi:hypothetical protein